MGFFKEFREFAMHGSVTDMAIGIIIGGAFGKIVTSLVNDIVMPSIGLLTGGGDFKNLFFDLSGNNYPTLAIAREAGAPVIAYGSFLSTTLDFLIIALTIFLVIRYMNKLKNLKDNNIKRLKSKIESLKEKEIKKNIENQFK